MLRESRQAFFSSLDTASAKEFWKAVKILGRKNTTLSSIPNDTTQAVTGQGKACLATEQFFSIPASIAAVLLSLQTPLILTCN